jgi:hypothetical protein
LYLFAVAVNYSNTKLRKLKAVCFFPFCLFERRSLFIGIETAAAVAERNN